MTALKQGCNGSLDVGVGMLPAGLPLVHSHAHLLPQNGWPILGQPLTQLRQPPHEADHCCAYCEGMHAEVYTAGLTAGVDCQTEVTLPAGRLENLHRNSYHRQNPHCSKTVNWFVWSLDMCLPPKVRYVCSRACLCQALFLEPLTIGDHSCAVFKRQSVIVKMILLTTLDSCSAQHDDDLFIAS